MGHGIIGRVLYIHLYIDVTAIIKLSKKFFKNCRKNFFKNLLTKCNINVIIVYIEIIQFILAMLSGKLTGI